MSDHEAVYCPMCGAVMDCNDEDEDEFARRYDCPDCGYCFLDVDITSLEGVDDIHV